MRRGLSFSPNFYFLALRMWLFNAVVTAKLCEPEGPYRHIWGKNVQITHFLGFGQLEGGFNRKWWILHLQCVHHLVLSLLFTCTSLNIFNVIRFSILIANISLYTYIQLCLSWVIHFFLFTERNWRWNFILICI